MRHSSPFGIGRLTRAAICGLLAAIAIPTAASAASPVLASPFTLTMPNPCFATDIVTITGHVTVYSDVQPDGTVRSYSAYSGSAVSATGVRYGFSNEVHQLLDVDLSTLKFYDYFKLIRQRDDAGVLSVINPPTGTGDDFIVRVFVNGPSDNSLMTITDGFCR